jgi:type I restriction-modification system DNA methylase subunit
MPRVQKVDPDQAELFVTDNGGAPKKNGNGGFLAQSYEHMRAALGDDITAEQIDQLKRHTFYGREKENLIYPIALANLLPGGVFTTAGAGVKTNLLFFTKGKPTERIWYYDLSDIKVGKKTPFTAEKFGDFFELLKTRGDSPRSSTIDRKTINAKNYDLKAVNPKAPDGTDRRTPEELLAIIDAKGREVEEALAPLRELLKG